MTLRVPGMGSVAGWALSAGALERGAGVSGSRSGAGGAEVSGRFSEAGADAFFLAGRALAAAAFLRGETGLAGFLSSAEERGIRGPGRVAPGRGKEAPEPSPRGAISSGRAPNGGSAEAAGADPGPMDLHSGHKGRPEEENGPSEQRAVSASPFFIEEQPESARARARVKRSEVFMAVGGRRSPVGVLNVIKNQNKDTPALFFGATLLFWKQELPRSSGGV